mmetsp:Transcript_44961/g.140959  ORF Transcript_44961/g.140959 Transcript_44961/m.140959 type:complete len:227 (-) Transcript_44961:237-917(-)
MQTRACMLICMRASAIVEPGHAQLSKRGRKDHEVVLGQARNSRLRDQPETDGLDLRAEDLLSGPHVLQDPTWRVALVHSLVTDEVDDHQATTGPQGLQEALAHRLGVLYVVVDVAEENHVDTRRRQAGIQSSAGHDGDVLEPAYLHLLAQVLLEMWADLDGEHTLRLLGQNIEEEARPSPHVRDDGPLCQPHLLLENLHDVGHRLRNVAGLGVLKLLDVRLYDLRL